MTLNCTPISSLPFGGAEVLVLTLVFMALVISFCVTFFDVGLKQMWPSTFLDPAVAARVAQIKRRFPALGAESTHDQVNLMEKPMGEKNVDIAYTHIVASEPYISGQSVDEDLIPILVNNDAFSTVSSYCSSSIRGYMTLAVILICAGITLGFLWVHNTLIDPNAGDSAGKVALLGYILVFLTSIVMCGPDGNAVYRNSNIALFSNIPVNSALIKLHVLGIGSFIALPMLGHAYRAFYEGPSMPNYTATLSGCVAQLVGALYFGIASWIGGKCGVSKVMGKKLTILAEIYCVLVTFIAYLQFEFYPTAACAGSVTAFNTGILAAIFIPIARLVMKHYANAPTSFATQASLMLMNGEQPVATAGPCAALAYDQKNIPHLPHILLSAEQP